MKNFIKVFTEEDKEILTKKGYTYIFSEKLGNSNVYVFKNDVNKQTFSKEDRERFLFTNILNF